MKHLFIVNPKAGGRDMSEDIRALAENAFKSNSDKYEIYTTKAPGDATEEVRRRAETGENYRIYSCGGDGTFNECVSGAVNKSNIAVCPFPFGTGNDFCRMFGEEQKLFTDMDAVIAGTEHDIDVIDCNGRYSINICSVGIDARIGTNVHKYSSIPLIGGATGYVVSAIVEICKGISRHMVIRSSDYAADGKFALVCACNGRYYGGGFNPSTDAMPDDGILDIYIISDVNLLTLAALIGKYAKGRGDELPKYITHLRSDHVSIEFDEDNVINLDGEAMSAKKVDMKLIPKAVKMIVPRGMRFF
jgi:YegS/Rv2252/BmrU family lipid kinase